MWSRLRESRRMAITSIVSLGALVALIAATAAPSGLPSSPPPSHPPQAHTVRLIIDYGDGVQKHFTSIEWKKEMTVLDALNDAKASSHGITFQNSGSGATAFLTKIDDLANEGGGGKRNWIYWVNTTLGDKSCGVYKLEPSDVVLWKFSGQQIKH
jgi:hypothetical protein